MRLGNLIVCKFICKLSGSDQYSIYIWAVLSLWLNILLLLGVIKPFFILNAHYSVYLLQLSIFYTKPTYIAFENWFQVFLITVLSCLHQNTLLT